MRPAPTILACLFTLIAACGPSVCEDCGLIAAPPEVMEPGDEDEGLGASSSDGGESSGSGSESSDTGSESSESSSEGSGSESGGGSSTGEAAACELDSDLYCVCGEDFGRPGDCGCSLGPDGCQCDGKNKPAFACVISREGCEYDEDAAGCRCPGAVIPGPCEEVS